VIGYKTILQSHVVIEGEVVIGTGNFIGHGAVIGAPPQDVRSLRNEKTRIEVGNEKRHSRILARSIAGARREARPKSATRIF